MQQANTLEDLAQLGYDLRDYRVRIMPEPTTDGFVVYGASVEELPGLDSQGDSIEEARENLKDAFVMYVSDMLRRRMHVPPPPSPRATAVRVAVWNAPRPPVHPSSIPDEDINRLLPPRYDPESRQQPNRRRKADQLTTSGVA